ncbi:MAG: hypothetical protein GKS00_07235 [Alphaproteobacteria bacterium]|nr:hypothetical protein [Alphaproteobacteria bacterium]
MTRHLIKAPLLLAAALALSACVSEAEDAIACPSVEVLQDLGELVRFKPGPGRDPTDVLVEAWIDGVGGQCFFDGEELNADLIVRIGSRRGPATKSDKATIGYFVAITDLNRKVLSRQAFKTTAPFSNRKTILFEDTLDLNIPLPRRAQTDSFTIYVGLELSEQELAFNRRKQK